MWTQKVLQSRGIVFPDHPLSWSRWMDGNFHAFSWFEGYLWSWRIYVQDTPPKYSIYGQPKVKADSWLGWQAKADLLTGSEGQGHFHIWKKMDILKVKDGHLTLLAYLPIALSLIWKYDGATPNLWQSVWQTIYFIQSKMRKTSGFRRKQVSSMGTGKQFYILLRLAITHYRP